MAQTDDDRQEPVAPQPKEPHLLDLADLADVAQWLLLVVASGVTYDAMKVAAIQLLKTMQRQKGRDHVRQLRARVLEHATKGREEIDEEAAQRIRLLFKDFT